MTDRPGRGPALWAWTRGLVVAATLVAPLAHAAMLNDRPPLGWLTLAGLAIGLLGRPLGPARVLAVLVAIAPLWQALVGIAVDSTDIHLVMPWLAAVAACLAIASPTRWRTAGPWAASLAAWAVVLALTWPVTAARELDFTMQAIRAMAAGGVGSPPRDSAALVMLAAEAQLVALLLFDWWWGAAARERRVVWRAIAPGLLVACGTALWQSVHPEVLSVEPWIGLARAAGPFYDGNAMGALAALFGPALAAGALTATHPDRVARAAFWLALSLGAIVASGSRTALAGWLVGATLLVAAEWRGRRWLWAAIVVATVAVAAVGLARLQGGQTQTNAVTRLFATARAAMADGGQSLVRVIWNRDGFGPASMAVIAEHPWVGVGPGVLSGVIAGYSLEIFDVRLPGDNAQNWWRHQAAELGFVGALGPFACSVLAVLAVVGLWQRRRDGGTVTRAAPIVAVGLMAVVGPPMHHPILQVLIGLLLAGCIAPAAASLPPGQRPGPSAMAAVIWIVAASCAITLGVQGPHFTPAYRAARFHTPYDYGFSGPMKTPFGEGRWAARRAVAVIGRAGRTLVLGIVLPHDDLATAPVHVAVTDGRGVTCARDVRDHTAFECRLPVPLEPGPWPMVEVEVSRPWQVAAGLEQAALVTARLEP